jgi:peptidoglycan/LPS O-acetylase OafA/YrhL
MTLAVLAIAPAIALATNVSGPMYYWLFFIFPPYRFGEFFIGMILARAVQLGLRLPRAVSWQLVACLGLAGAVYGLTRYTLSTGSSVSRPYAALLALPFLVLLVLGAVTLDLEGARSWLCARPMLRLGEWSFALYLVHKPIFLLTEQWNWWNQATGVFGDLVGFSGFCVLVIAAAAMLYYGVERPLERTLRRVPDSLGPAFLRASGFCQRIHRPPQACLPSCPSSAEDGGSVFAGR